MKYLVTQIRALLACLGSVTLTYVFIASYALALIAFVLLIRPGRALWLPHWLDHLCMMWAVIGIVVVFFASHVIFFNSLIRKCVFRIKASAEEKRRLMRRIFNCSSALSLACFLSVAIPHIYAGCKLEETWRKWVATGDSRFLVERDIILYQNGFDYTSGIRFWTRYEDPEVRWVGGVYLSARFLDFAFGYKQKQFSPLELIESAEQPDIPAVH